MAFLSILPKTCRDFKIRWRRPVEGAARLRGLSALERPRLTPPSWRPKTMCTETWTGRSGGGLPDFHSELLSFRCPRLHLDEGFRRLEGLAGLESAPEVDHGDLLY